MRFWLRLQLFTAIFLAIATMSRAAEAQTSGTMPLVLFDNLAKFQMEVWINNSRVGFTPVTRKLKPGRYALTATAESIVPITQTIVVGPKGDQAVYIPPVPLTGENYPETQKSTAEIMAHMGSNPHLVIIALYLALDPQDSQALLARADRMIPGDGTVDSLRAKALLKAKDIPGARAAADRAVKKLPSYCYVWRVRAETLIAADELNEALDSAERAVTIDPENWRNYRIRALVYQAMVSHGADKSAERAADVALADDLYRKLNELNEQAKAAIAATPAPVAGKTRP
ncbi:hypothetical protein BH09SUM1_BH09SUM1_04430 [soil metagenome]